MVPTASPHDSAAGLMFGPSFPGVLTTSLPPSILPSAMTIVGRFWPCAPTSDSAIAPTIARELAPTSVSPIAPANDSPDRPDDRKRACTDERQPDRTGERQSRSPRRSQES